MCSFVYVGNFSRFSDGQLMTALIATPNLYSRTAANPYAGSKLTHPSSPLNHSFDLPTPPYNALGALQFQIARPVTLLGPVTIAPAYQPVFYWYPGTPVSLQGSYYAYPSTVAMKGLPVTAQPGDVVHFLEGVFEVSVSAFAITSFTWYKVTRRKLCGAYTACQSLSRWTTVVQPGDVVHFLEGVFEVSLSALAITWYNGSTKNGSTEKSKK